MPGQAPPPRKAGAAPPCSAGGRGVSQGESRTDWWKRSHWLGPDRSANCRQGKEGLSKFPADCFRLFTRLDAVATRLQSGSAPTDQSLCATIPTHAHSTPTTSPSPRAARRTIRMPAHPPTRIPRPTQTADRVRHGLVPLRPPGSQPSAPPPPRPRVQRRLQDQRRGLGLHHRTHPYQPVRDRTRRLDPHLRPLRKPVPDQRLERHLTQSGKSVRGAAPDWNETVAAGAAVTAGAQFAYTPGPTPPPPGPTPPPPPSPSTTPPAPEPTSSRSPP